MQSNNTPVSVIIPSYNRPGMLFDAIESILNQTFKYFELIVVDDGSPQSLAPVVDNFDDHRIRYHRFDENQGANAARNWGIEHANGEFIAFLDDDDRWEPTKLEKQISVFADNSSVGFVYTGQRFVDEDGNTLSTKTPNASGTVTRYLLKGGYIGGYSCAMVRKDIIQSVGKPDPELPILQDREWWLRLSSATRFEPVEEPLVIRRIGDYENIGSRYEELRDISYPKIYNKHKEMARKEGVRFKFQFKSRLLESVGRSALSTDRYSEAKYYLLKSLIYQPWSKDAFIRFVISLGGKRFYKLAKYIHGKTRNITS